MGDNIRNDIQWRKDWVARLEETERFFDNFSKTESMPYILYYSDDIKQGEVNYKTETVNLSVGTAIFADRDWPRPMGRALQAVYDGLTATKRKDTWQLGNWPGQGVTNLNAFATRRQNFSVVFELLNNQNKVIGRQTLEAGGALGFNRGGRPNVEISTSGSKTLNFQNVNANDITDRMTIRVASVNGADARVAAKNGVLQIKIPAATTAGAALRDSRDGKSYRTVNMGGQTWMAENLNYQTSGSKCYGNDASNCAKYGRLYNWKDAMGACPAGWRLSTYGDWDILDGLAGIGGSEGGAGKKLKSKTGWNNNGNGTDEFGFAALPGGLGDFGNAGNGGLWWSASERNASSAYGRYMYYDSEDASWYSYDKNFLFSVRCVRD